MSADTTQRTLVPNVSLFFTKKLSGEAGTMSYAAHAHSDDAAITLSIEGLKRTSKGAGGASINECNLYPRDLIAKLVLFHGSDGGVLPRPSKFQGMEINCTKNEAFIYWRIGSIAALESIASSIYRNKMLFVQVETLETQDGADALSKQGMLRIEVESVSLGFE